MAIFNPQIVPLVTPFTDDTSALSEVRFSRLVRFHREHGASAFVIASEAGEVHALSLSERKQLLEWAIREAIGLPVYVNVSASTTAAVVDLAQHAERHGARAGVFDTPQGLSLTADETSSYIGSVRRYGNLACAFLGRHDLERDTPSGVTAQSYQESGLERFALHPEATPEEFVHENMTASPLAVFGSDKAAVIAERWDGIQVKIRALFDHGRSHRLGKAVLGEFGVELGHTRGPIRDLDPRATQVLDSLMAEIA